MPAAQTSAAASNAFGNRIAQSNFLARNSEASFHFLAKPEAPRGASYGISSLQKGSRPYRPATHGLARMVMEASGNRRRNACKAGTDITASPTQFVARTNMLRNCIQS